MSGESGSTVAAIEPRPPVLSVIVPMFNESDGLLTFIDVLTESLCRISDSYEIVVVDDGSADSTLHILTDLAQQDSRIKIVSLSRNFGKDVALTAGIDYCTGDAVIPLDADLQDPPDLIPTMLQKWQEGFDVVVCARSDRGSDSIFKRATAFVFYRMINTISEVVIPQNVGDFRLMDRKVVEAVKLMPERTRFMKGIFAWVGFSTTTIYYSRPQRHAGESKWHYLKLWRFALDGLFSFSTQPLNLWSYLGGLCAALAFLYLMFVVLRTMIHGVDVPGYASLVSVMLLFNGLIMMSIGILGEYIGRIFVEVKGRPLYIVKKTIGFDE